MRLINYFLGLFDNSIVENKYQKSILKEYEVDWLRVIPFILIHLAIFTVFLVGFSYTALLVFLLMYSIRMFAITGFYHRYFSHKAFKTSRIMQFIFAIIGASAVQRGPIWWAAHHRGHHVHSDTEQDKHSPKSHGFFWSHMGWFLSKANFLTHQKFVKELMRAVLTNLLNCGSAPSLCLCSMKASVKIRSHAGDATFIHVDATWLPNLCGATVPRCHATARKIRSWSKSIASWIA